MSRKSEPVIPKATRTAPATAPTNFWFRKKCMSSIGCGTRSSHSTNPASTETPRDAVSSTWPEAQPCSGPEMIAKTTAVMPIVESSAPSRSGRSPWPFFDSGTSRATATRPIRATGMLMRKIAPHQKWSRTNPPNSGPAAKPREETVDQMPIALTRSVSSKIWTTTASVVVSSSAPPTPIPARAAMSWPEDWESPATSEPTPNQASPTISIFLRP